MVDALHLLLLQDDDNDDDKVGDKVGEVAWLPDDWGRLPDD